MPRTLRARPTPAGNDSTAADTPPNTVAGAADAQVHPAGVQTTRSRHRDRAAGTRATEPASSSPNHASSPRPMLHPQPQSCVNPAAGDSAECEKRCVKHAGRAAGALGHLPTRKKYRETVAMFMADTPA